MALLGPGGNFTIIGSYTPSSRSLSAVFHWRCRPLTGLLRPCFSASMVKAVREAGIAASVSQTAGTFVCNQVFYLLQHALAGTAIRSGFIHVPPSLPDQVSGAAQPSMALVTMVEGLRVALQTAWDTQVDIVQTGGQVS